MKKTWITLSILLAVCYFQSHAYAEPGLVVASAKKEQVMTGYTRPAKAVVLTSEVAGKVVRVNYKTGDPVGEKPIVEIDSTFVALSIENSQLQIKQIDSKIKSMASQVDFLKSAHDRMAELRKTQNISEVKYDEAENNLTQAKNDLDALKFEKERLKIAHKQLLEQLARHRIFGFRGGIITGLPVETGETVQPGAPLAEVCDYGTMVVPLSVSNEELMAFKSLPSPFDATINGIPVKARINYINPRFDEKTMKLQIEIAVRDYSGSRRGGLKFQTFLKVKTDGVLVPKKAVKNRFGNPTVTPMGAKEGIPVMILGETGDCLIVVETKRIKPGVVLMPAKTL
jgi:RND family efflux transporter MFP subunit